MVQVVGSPERMRMRVLLQNEAGLYLQPSGRWGNNRQTAREFETFSLAYLWAKEHQLVELFVIMAFPDQAMNVKGRSVQ